MPQVSEDTRSANRRRLVDAARRCAAGKGYRVFTVDDVCREARVSKGAFYTYFSSKEDLLVEIIEDDAAATGAELEDVGDTLGNDVDRLRAYVQASLKRAEDPANVQLRADVWSEMLTSERVRTSLDVASKQVRARLVRMIERAESKGDLVDAPPIALAAVLTALIDGLVLHRSLDPSSFRWSKVEVVLDLILDGLRREER